MRILAKAIALGAVGALVWACGSSDGSTYVGSCSRACNEAKKCDSTIDTETCSNACQNELAAVGPKLSNTYLSEVDQCIAAANCAELAAQFVLNSCDRAARASIGASSQATSYCEASIVAGEECSRFALGQGACLELVKVFSDSALSSAEACFSQSCDQHAACVLAELGLSMQDVG